MKRISLHSMLKKYLIIATTIPILIFGLYMYMSAKNTYIENQELSRKQAYELIQQRIDLFNQTNEKVLDHSTWRLRPCMRKLNKHPSVGYDIIKEVSFLKDAALVVRHHHEKFDGSGYPDGLSKEDIPLMSRIISIADAYDAMTSIRAYRKKTFDKNAGYRGIENKCRNSI